MRFVGNREEFPILLISGIVVMFLMVILALNLADAQRNQTSEEPPLVVVFAVDGVETNTGEILHWVTVNNVTKTLFYNASQYDLQDPARDGIIEPGITFPNGTAQVGDKFRACTVVAKIEGLQCFNGFKSPTGRGEFVPVLLSSFKKQQ